MDERITLYGAQGSGAVPVEAALRLIGEPYDLIDAYTWDEDDVASGDQVLAVNPMRQVPALVLPGGEVVTESTAILIGLAERYPQAKLSPLPGDPQRLQFLRWMSFVSSAIYSLYWVKDDPSRLAPDRAAQPKLVSRVKERIADCWRRMDAQVSPGRYILGDELSVLDLYVTVVSRFQPNRVRFYKVAPKMAEVVRRVDADPRLEGFWGERMPFEQGWEGKEI